MELKNWKLFCLAALLSLECFAQQTIAPFKTQQANTVFYVNMANATTLTTIQKTVTAACAYSTSTLVDILPGANPSDTIAGLTSACSTTQIFDQRVTPAMNYTCNSGGCALVPYSTGTVSSVSATGTQGVTVTVSTPNSTPAIAIGLGAITPTSLSTATITNTSRTSGDVVASGSGGVQIDGPAVANLPQLTLSNAFIGSMNSFLGITATNITNTSLTSGDLVLSGTGGIQTNGPAASNVALLNAATNSFTGNIIAASLQTTGGAGIIVQNGALQVSTITPATSGENFNSPFFSIDGTYWNGTASETDTWRCAVTMGAGTNPASTYTCSHSSGTSGFASLAFTNFVQLANGFSVGSAGSSLPTTGGPATIVGSAGLGGLMQTSAVTSLPPNSDLVSFQAGATADSGINASGGHLTGVASIALATCISSATPAVCGTSSTGFVVIPVGAAGNTVNTTAVTANSKIFVTSDPSLGSALGITCDSTPTITEAVSVPNLRTPGTSFGFVEAGGNVATNPACYSYLIIN